MSKYTQSDMSNINRTNIAIIQDRELDNVMQVMIEVFCLSDGNMNISNFNKYMLFLENMHKTT